MCPGAHIPHPPPCLGARVAVTRANGLTASVGALTVAGRAAARSGRPHRYAGGAAQSARRVSSTHRRPAADLRGAIRAGHPERQSVHGSGGKEPPAGMGEPAKVAFGRQYEPGAAHATQRHHRADRDDGQQCGARGRVTVASEPGKGSVFTVRLPGGADSQARSSTGSDGRRSPSADCVLVIDDDATARELIADHLKAEGFSVVTAAGGAEGVKLAKELRPTAITLDVMMPDLDGWSVLAALRQDPELAEIPVIMITIVDEHRRGIALGAAGYLTKPIDRERLHRLVTRFRASTPPTRVLLVEDDAVQRERMRGWLEGPHWAVREAANGREALDRLQQGKPDVILLDLMMPEMDGFAVVAALQKEPAWRDIPVIVITALDLDAKDHERLNAGVQFVLVKERFRPADLVERVRWLVQKKPASVSNGMEAAS